MGIYMNVSVKEICKVVSLDEEEVWFLESLETLGCLKMGLFGLKFSSDGLIPKFSGALMSGHEESVSLPHSLNYLLSKTPSGGEMLVVTEMLKGFVGKIRELFSHHGVSLESMMDEGKGEASSAEPPESAPVESSATESKTVPSISDLMNIILGETYDGEGRKRVPLGLAKYVGQEVDGTSSSSGYVCIAVGSKFNLAVRSSGSTLSVRAERSDGGCKWAGEIAKLSSFGMKKNTAGHVSCHFNAETLEKKERAIGSLVFSLKEVGQFTSWVGEK